jgi:hypothetical protein
VLATHNEESTLRAATRIHNLGLDPASGTTWCWRLRASGSASTLKIE